ncbi:PEP-CTERM sorting domain-containing protein [Leptolyngbya sp. FACHB-261]|uniref:Vgb family protein n=1 Tax=Leptolyngbya sp. FACHB-261 TaxID=2692806 RepID=UPI001687BF5D|nr:PEP-CTERM sorting domain-containing protein [Leptolyngbya sp. FACHB-261]MBD2104181.1 PEP-CTERM sorting domain-containing protein [Leptolyngbya sp. FACHB-261]
MRNSLLLLRATLLLGTLAAFNLEGPKAEAALLIGNTRGNNVVTFSERTGQFLGDFIAPGSGGLVDPDDLTFGPDGNLYVSSGKTAASSAILRFNAKTGQFIDVFASGGGLFRPYGSAFGPDGNLYVSSFLSDQILRYDGTTGAFLDVFAAGNGLAGGLNGPNDLLFGSDGSLYVTTQGSIAVNGTATFPGLPSQVLRFDIATKNSTVFIEQPSPSPDSFGFVSFLGLAFGPRGDLFVSDFANDIRRYDLSTASLVDTLSTNYTNTIPSSNFVGNLTFGASNLLYTVGFDNSPTGGELGAILRYDSTTGAPLPSLGNAGPIFVPTNDKLLRPIGIAYLPTSVPEPASILGFLVLGALGLFAELKRERKPAE